MSRDVRQRQHCRRTNTNSVTAKAGLRAICLVSLAALALGGCGDQEITEPVLGEPSFYNTAGGYWQVTKVADTDDGACDADCSLREAIAAAAAGDEIRFAAAATGTIPLTDRLSISQDLTITGPGASVLNISGENTYQVFYISPGVTVSISGLTITNGKAPGGPGRSADGGGIETSGTLTLSDCVVSGNHALNYGGGIENRGTLTITGSTITGNYSETQNGSGGGIHSSGNTWMDGKLSVLSITESTISENYARSYGGGIWASGILTLVRSTVSGNLSEGWAGGGGIYYSGYWGGASAATILNSTVSGNTAPRAGGINQYTANGVLRIILSTISGNVAATLGGGGGAGVHSDGPVQVKGSIIWGNTLAGTPDDVAASTVMSYNSLGYNLIGAAGENVDFTQEFVDGTDRTGVTDAGLGSLADNGGPTRTYALTSGSPAIDTGTCTDHAATAVGTDQRNVARPQGAGCDVGAFELAASPPDPGDALEALIEASEDAGLTRGTVSKLRDALKHLWAGRTTPAVNKVREYIQDVQSQSGKKVTVEDAAALAASAEEIIEMILAAS